MDLPPKTHQCPERMWMSVVPDGVAVPVPIYDMVIFRPRLSAENGTRGEDSFRPRGPFFDNSHGRDDQLTACSTEHHRGVGSTSEYECARDPSCACEEDSIAS